MENYYKTNYDNDASVDKDGDIKLEDSSCVLYLTRADLVKLFELIDAHAKPKEIT